MSELEKLQNKPRGERTPIESCIVDAAIFEEAEHDGEIELMERAADDHAELWVRVKKLTQWLGVVLDQVDYTSGACGPTEMVGAVLPKDVIIQARSALRGERTRL